MSEQVSEKLDRGPYDTIAERLGQLMRVTNDEGKSWEGINQTQFKLSRDDEGHFLLASDQTVVAVDVSGHSIDFVGETPESTADLPVSREEQATMMVLGAMVSHPLLREEQIPPGHLAEFDKLTIHEKIWLVALEIGHLAPSESASEPVVLKYCDVTSEHTSQYRLSYYRDADSAVYPVIERLESDSPSNHPYKYDGYALTVAELAAYRDTPYPNPNSTHYSSDYLQPMHDLLIEMRDRALSLGWTGNKGEK